MSRLIYCYAECRYVECHYAECHVLCFVMLNVIMLNAVMLSVIMLNVVMRSVVAPLPRHLKAEGLNPATTKGTGRESAKYVCFRIV
jgi:hypothetical protein